MPTAHDRPPPVTVPRPGVIRPARVTDAAALAAIDASGQINPWSERQFAAVGGDAENAAATALVSDDNGLLQGYVVFAQVLDEASIHRIAVHPERRGRGLGQVLLRAALAHMRREGATRCLLEVRQSNGIARRLYENNGFRLDGVRKQYYPTHSGREDALLFSLKL